MTTDSRGIEMKLEDIGLVPQLLVGGFAGGVVHAFVFKETSPMAAVGSVMAGALCANYIAPVVASIPYMDKVGLPTCAFIVGLSAMVIVQGIVAAVKANVDRFGTGTTEKKP